VHYLSKFCHIAIALEQTVEFLCFVSRCICGPWWHCISHESFKHSKHLLHHLLLLLTLRKDICEVCCLCLKHKNYSCQTKRYGGFKNPTCWQDMKTDKVGQTIHTAVPCLPLSSYLGLETGYPDWHFMSFYSLLFGKCWNKIPN
jgi:hypothetical protein